MRTLGFTFGCMFVMASFSGAAESPIPVGVAKIDVTPSYAVRLSGYGSRRAESDGVAQHVWAKALAIGADGEVVIVITVDNLGVPETICGEIAKRLKIPRERLAVCSSHTHSAPMLTNVCPTLFGLPIPPEHQKNIDRYTKELTDALTKVATNALADRRPGRLEWAKGTVGFAANRRTRGGVVDHDLPVLKVVRDGAIIAIWVNYSCHCTTLGGEFNKLHGDWAGAAQEFIERSYPGVTALVSIGCGADANPNPRGNVTIAEEHGQAIVRELTRLFTGEWTPLPGKIDVRFEKIDLPFDKIPTRDQWEALAKQPGAVGYHAQYQLKKLDRGETIPEKISYPVQTWTFGDRLAMVFLAGEVVVDYALRLKKEYAADKIWVNGYSNDATCYIPSQRILREGGYEGGGAMIYYDRPTKFAPAVEDVIFAAVRKQIPPGFKAPKDPKEFPPPKSPEDSRKAIQVKPGFRVDLVASEPQISSPVAIDWGTDGRLWVVEMYDYPTGVDGNYKPGGRVKYLEDTKGTGQYDKVTVLADDVPFPTGIMAWHGGALVCAAPDILYMEDTKRDGKCDVRKVLFTGFTTENYQARVNGLTMGLDGWVYGANGLLGGKIKSTLKPGLEVNLGGRDFRMKPDTGEFEPASGLTQQGRARDDWGNWFGGDNSNLLRHYPLPEHYLRRNPHVAGPPPFVDVLRGGDADPNKLFPASHTLSRFNDLYMANRTTSACSPTIYRDNLLGQEYYGNAFICEPVHNLVTRRVLEPRGTTFLGKRAPDEQSSEFLASTDNWFRPVQVRNGPDGALWVVDMYRFVIEHPRWIPPQRLAELDVRAGADRGRIYRVSPEKSPPRKVPRLDKLEQAELVKQLESPNGVVRDLTQRLIVERRDMEFDSALARIARRDDSPLARLHAFCALDLLHSLSPADLKLGLKDRSPGVRRHAIRLAEWSKPGFVSGHKDLANDPDTQVRLQLACSAEELLKGEGPECLLELLQHNPNDAYITAAVWSSLNPGNIQRFAQLIFELQNPAEEWIVKTLATATAVATDQMLDQMIRDLDRSMAFIGSAWQGHPKAWQLVALAEMFEACVRKKLPAGQYLSESQNGKAPPTPRIAGYVKNAETVAMDDRAPESLRLAAIRLLAWSTKDQSGFDKLGHLLAPRQSPAVQAAALRRLAQTDDPAVPSVLLREWKAHSPALRAQVLDVFLSRNNWVPALCDAIRDKSVAPSDLDTVRTQRLLLHSDANVRSRAAAALKTNIDPNRQKLIDTYRADAKQASDATRGRAVYEKSCAACHKIGDTGHAIGPDLAAVTDRSTDALLIAILDPNRALDARYSNHLATTKRGLQYSGMLQSETATSITLVGPEGKKQEILRTELEEFTNTGKSLMPDGVEKEIPPAAMADLIAFLQSLGRPPKSVAGNKPKAVAASTDGVIRLKATDCEIYGNEITFEAEFANLGMWHAEGDHAVWSLEVPKDGKYRVEMTYACDFGAAGNAFAVQVGAAAFTEKVVGTGRWSDYRSIKVGELDLKAGHTRLTFRPAGPVRGALLDLKEVRLVPVK